ncbi:flavin reductase family protein [bacterium (Candidatus Blackallbacteria) CG17_big_fil_post_rev_8_21_14_2_50_48_46]|uniref:Flavin reductase family protein n=1 Tax=bacterium (Candidatus Blackallbacteria) CG17_big_fil_post_rev_8_21_14_2_50_48_46 TaxID=2014261 RepID=A0A2M7GAK3_9BACT|nr:MAG: flavin reductase [bacterium (Candidatus Blackallbacteria) CG18_big_fil_WC_8_21_14_2_50_49_26]PIW19177.1 MAG: flavin reductase family protein [bacterium (Candidatus Blackallbacteria) CG17_big_fil_post_rev_8_21_14_2_50_48_46]PIW45473.1 MAG: flavin reductase family protein [bacterium (Candidatus Blackallbacteria) CG13_big_fil_rev_8_21_14_2_50_49_14]
MSLTLLTSEKTWQEIYRRLTEIIQPRPIALVSTLNSEGESNLAPFSFYTLISCNPPYLAFSPQLAGRTGQKKDTLRNLEIHPQFVVATVTEAIAERVNQASAPLPYGESEFQYAGLTPVPAQLIKGNRVKESPVNMECELVEIRSYGEEGGAGNLVVGKILCIEIDERVLNQAGAIDPALLKAVGRMGGEDWCRTSETFAYPRPDRA